MSGEPWGEVKGMTENLGSLSLLLLKTNSIAKNVVRNSEYWPQLRPTQTESAF